MYRRLVATLSDTHRPHLSDASTTSLKSLLHDLECAKKAAATILQKDYPELFRKWREETAYLKGRTAEW